MTQKEQCRHLGLGTLVDFPEVDIVVGDCQVE